MSHKLSEIDVKDMNLFGRRWKVKLLIPNDSVQDDWLGDGTSTEGWKEYTFSDSSDEDRSVRATFKIQKYGWVTPNFSEVSVYNLDFNTFNMAFMKGMRVIVEAGYVNGWYGVILDSPVFQPIWERENGIDYKLTFRCIDTDGLLDENWVNGVVGALTHQKNCVAEIGARAKKKFVPKISSAISEKKYIRGKTFCGDVKFYLRQIALDNGMTISAVDNKIYLSKVQVDFDQVPVMEFSLKEGGLIGTPVQTQDGITFTCLLNPKIQVFKEAPMLVKLNLESLKNYKISWSQPFSRLDESGVYKVLGVTHYGDTRGNNWYSEVICLNQILEGVPGTKIQR